MTKKTFLSTLFAFILCMCMLPISSYSQIAIRHQAAPPHKPDSIDIQHYAKKNGWMATGQIFGLNMGIWAFDRYIQKADFAYISSRTISKNFRKGFVWDNDQMGTNMFLHPYHGSLYYNAARSNGYGYWASGGYALAGSAMWELLLENEYPSINDIIATPIGGLTLGEVFYRSSDLILDDRATGNRRFGREAAAFIIAPTRGLTRIMNGDAWRKRSTSGRQFGIPDISIELSAGVRALELKDQILDRGMGAALTLNLEYGDKFETEKQKPYDYFSVNADFNIQKAQPILSKLNITGRLHVTDLIDTETDFLSIGAYQHFDYYDSDTISDVSKKIPYKFCTPASFGGGLMYKNKRFANKSFEAYAHVNTVLLGGSLSDHYVVDQRNYNLASGLSIKMGASMTFKDRLALSLTYEGYKMYTWKGYPSDFDWDTLDPHEFSYQGDQSQAILHAVSFRTDLKVHNQWYLTGIYNNYTRDTNYTHFPDVSSLTSEGRVMLTYKF